MTDLSRDPITNIIYKGIKQDIRVLLNNRCYRGLLILAYSGIDTMAFLGMPEGQVEVKPSDFIEWAEKYIRFPCKEQVTGEELYAARCGILHTYTPFSRRSRSGQCRTICYMDKSVPEVRYAPDKCKELVLVSIRALAEAFLQGVDKFLVDIYADKRKGRIADERFKHMFKELPAQKDR